MSYICELRFAWVHYVSMLAAFFHMAAHCFMWVHYVLLGALCSTWVQYFQQGYIKSIFSNGCINFHIGVLWFTWMHYFSWGHYVSHGHLRFHMSTFNGYIMF